MTDIGFAAGIIIGVLVYVKGRRDGHRQAEREPSAAVSAFTAATVTLTPAVCGKAHKGHVCREEPGHDPPHVTRAEPWRGNQERKVK